jgi:hypothetical protein
MDAQSPCGLEWVRVEKRVYRYSSSLCKFTFLHSIMLRAAYLQDYECRNGVEWGPTLVRLRLPRKAA